MQPKLTVNERTLQKELIASNVIQEDYIKTHISHPLRRGLKPWKAPHCAPNAESPFGDFPDILKTKTLNKAKTTKTSEPVQTKQLSSSVKKVMKEDKSGTNSVDKIPKKTNLAKGVRKIEPTLFRNMYDRGSIPIRVQHGGSLNRIEWVIEPSKVDLKFLLPLFVDGFKEKMDPYRFIAIMGSMELLEQNTKERVIETVPLLILPMKTALNTRDVDIIILVCKFLEKLLTAHAEIGKYLVPYYRQILPIFNIFKTSNVNIGHKIEYNQRKALNVGDLIEETLNLLEVTGGEDAFINIKYMIPTYESYVYV